MTQSKKKSPSASAKATDYLHGFSKEEQDRLYTQARFLGPSVYQKVDFSQQNEILEVGSGVGAQTALLREKFPHLTVFGVDAQESQLSRAREYLKKDITEKKVQLSKADATKLPFPENRFDGAFLCWILEHVGSPVQVLKEVRRVLKPGGVIYCNEVLNATFYMHPYSPATLKYWFEFNDFQWSAKGDPFVGGKLANFLLEAGYQNIQTEVLVQHYDNRTPKMRARFTEFWTNLLMSGAENLIKAKRVTVKEVETMKEEFERVKHDPDAVIFYSWVQAKAVAL